MSTVAVCAFTCSLVPSIAQALCLLMHDRCFEHGAPVLNSLTNRGACREPPLNPGVAGRYWTFNRIMWYVALVVVTPLVVCLVCI